MSRNMGTMDTMQQSPKPPSAVGASWSTGIHCPRCGAEAASTHRERMPKWRCSDPMCSFRNYGRLGGWLLVEFWTWPNGDPMGAVRSQHIADEPNAATWMKT